MEVSNTKNKFTTENSRDNTNLQTEYLTYHKKLKNEMEAIPKEHKKLFRNALNKYSFDMEVYIPHLSDKNKKVYPNKNYLINKLIRYEKFVNLNKEKKEKNSRGLTKFSKYYNYIQDNNAKQRDYINNLLETYKNKGYELYNIEYKKKDNIFNRSILLDHNLGDDSNMDALKYGNNDENKKNFITDNQLLLKFNNIIHESKSPNAINRKKNNNNYNHFSDNINAFIKGTKNNLEEKQKKLIKKKKKKKKKKDKKNEKSTSLEEKSIIKNIEDEIELNKKEKNDNNNNNNSLNQINNDNKEEDNLNTSIKSNKNDNTITTYYGNESLVFNESKNNQENENIIKNKSNLKYSTFRGGGKNEKKELTFNIDVNINDNKNKNNFSLNDYNNNLKKNKYLLTSLNKVKLFKKEKQDNNIDINDKLSIFKDKEFDTKYMNKFKSKQNLKLNLPDIIPTSTSYNKNKSSYKLSYFNKNIIKDNNLDGINNINSKTKSKENNIQKKIKNLKEVFSKKYSKSDLEKVKKREINNLYSTINGNQNFFSEYPFDKVENYFRTFKNMKIPKINPNKGNNIHPLLDEKENIVKEKELYKIAKALNETKKDMYLRSTGTLDNFEKIETLDFEKIKEYDDKIPLLKYDFAENILCDNQKYQKKNN